MVNLSIYKPVNIEELQELLKLNLSHLRVKHLRFNKNVIVVVDGASIVYVQEFKGKLRITGSLNIHNIWILLGILLGIFLGLIPAVLFFIYCRVAYRKKYKALEVEVADFVTRSYSNIKK